jgi:hypothetical protein
VSRATFSDGASAALDPQCQLVRTAGRPGGEQRIVGTGRSGADHHGVDPAAHLVHHGPRRLTGDPAAVAADARKLAVERHRPLADDPRATGRKQLEIRPVELAGGRFMQADFHVEARGPQLRRAAAGDLRKRIFHRRDHPRDARPNNGRGARGRFAVMTTGLERDVERGAVGPIAGRLQGFDLGMRTAEAAMVTLADNLGSARDHATDQRIGLDPTATLGRQLERPLHVPGIEFARRIALLGRFHARSSVTTMCHGLTCVAILLCAGRTWPRKRGHGTRHTLATVVGQTKTNPGPRGPTSLRRRPEPGRSVRRASRACRFRRQAPRPPALRRASLADDRRDR